MGKVSTRSLITMLETWCMKWSKLKLLNTGPLKPRNLSWTKRTRRRATMKVEDRPPTRLRWLTLLGGQVATLPIGEVSRWAVKHGSILLKKVDLALWWQYRRKAMIHSLLFSMTKNKQLRINLEAKVVMKLLRTKNLTLWSGPSALANLYKSLTNMVTLYPTRET